MRWLKELFNPRLKCSRIGHKTRKVRWLIRKEEGIMVVATDYKVIIPTCSRCGFEAAMFDQKFYDSYTSVSMPSSMWDEMKENGHIRLRQL